MITKHVHICKKATPKGGKCCKYLYCNSGKQDTISVLTGLERLPKKKCEVQGTPESVFRPRLFSISTEVTSS